ncbi:excitatory amino acid transporter [Pimephales promelas]|nr:excitatory amino acid transporter [Pimephales promelas]
MEELLIPTEAEEAPPEPATFFSPAGPAKTPLERIKDCMASMFSVSVRKYVKDYIRRNGLLTLSVLAVITGCVLGFMLRGLALSTQAKIYFSFPGELLMRILKMLILPLITSSLMSGLSSMESKACCRMGVLTVTYYLWTTFIAVVVGIVLVLIIKPGYGTDVESNRLGGGQVITSADALLDLVRNMIPSNLIEATFQQYKTDLIPILKTPVNTGRPNFVYLMPDDDNQKGRTVLLELTPAPDIQYFPFGIIFLVAGKILDMSDPSTLGKKLGWYGVTVLAGLFVHGLILLPFFYFILTRKNPFTYIRGLLQAMVIALATSSSSATLPITMKCLLENCRVDRQIARFVLPVGATINMDGTALYEAVAAIFIAQVNEYELDFGQLVTISITATAASIGAAGIPQAGLVTMVIVLTSVGLPPDDITLIVAIDWILDRFRTMINVLGDALAAGIIAHLCRKDFPPDREAKANEAKQDTQTAHNMENVPLTEVPLLAGKDCIFEVVGDTVFERPTVYYNICQV